VQIEQLVPAETGWKAVFKEPEGDETTSRILGWAVLTVADEHEVVGMIVDPLDPTQIVPAPDAGSPDGGSFSRYRFVPPEPIKIAAPPPPEEPAPQEAATQLAKSVLKRGRK
jgi:hypothetical protein